MCQNQNAYLALVIFLRHFNVSNKEEHSKQGIPTDMLLVVNVSPLTKKYIYFQNRKLCLIYSCNNYKNDLHI